MLQIRHITKSYEGKPLLRGVSFDVAGGETVCLLGASGSGKSTLLRIITGLEDAEVGQVLWDGADLKDVPVHLRQFGLMFQDYALFPHRTVSENVGFGLKMQHLSKEEIDRQVKAALEQVNLAGFADRRVTDLSGGEQQRVALARALAPRPRLLMLDEPLGALDHNLREQLIGELHELLHQTGIPAIYVTHDQEEAFNLADRLVLLHNGQVEQSGPPQEVYAQPASAWAARFLGLNNLLQGKVGRTQPLEVETCLGVLRTANPTHFILNPGDRVTVLIRPTAAIIPPTDEANQVQAVVQDVAFRGLGFRVTFTCPAGQRLEFLLSAAPLVGERMQFSLRPDEMILLPAEDQP
jgi:spermidine/putrescine transport system ATP-binding protein